MLSVSSSDIVNGGGREGVAPEDYSKGLEVSLRWLSSLDCGGGSECGSDQ